MRYRTRLGVLNLERRDVPSGNQLFVTNEAGVNVYEALGPHTPPSGPFSTQNFQQAGKHLATIDPFPGQAGSVHVAIGDVTGDGTEDVVIGAGFGYRPLVQVYDGADLLIGKVTLLKEFEAFDSAFRGGVFVATGNQDTITLADEIIVGAGQSGGPHVRAFSLTPTVIVTQGLLLETPRQTGEFFAFQSDFRGGVRVGTGDFNGDGRDDIVCAAGQGGGPHVRVVDLYPPDPLALRPYSHAIIDEFFAYDAGIRSGVYIGVGELNGNPNSPEIVTTPGEYAGPHVRVWGKTNGTRLKVENEIFKGQGSMRVGIGNLGNNLLGQMSFYTADPPGFVYPAVVTPADQRLHAYHIINGQIVEQSLYLPAANVRTSPDGLFVGV